MEIKFSYAPGSQGLVIMYKLQARKVGFYIHVYTKTD